MQLVRCLIAALLAGVTLSQAQSPPASFTRSISYGGDTVTVDYVQHSVRGPNFEVLVQDGTGAFNAHTEAPSRIYLGTVQGHPGAMAAGLLKDDDRLITRITFENGNEWLHDGSSTSFRGNNNWTPNWPGFLPPSGGAGSSVYAAEVAVDAPHDLYLAAGGTVDDTVEICEFSVMATNLLYLRDAAILHQVGRVIVRTDTGQDPYESIGGNAGGLLGEVKDQWNNVLPASDHDLALVARRGVGGGVAWVNAVGTGNRYSANGCSSIGEFTVVWRHEVGHNWGLSHYDGGTPEGPTINSGNTLGRMSSPELKKALDHRDSRIALGILDNLGSYPFPIPPRASADRASFEPDGSPITLDVLDNDSDSNGEAISIAGFDATTDRGGSVSLSAGTGPGGRDELIYSPPAGLLEGTDHFSYRITDTAGREGVGYAIVMPEFSGDLAAHWNFDENAGATAKDATPAANDASINGTPGWTSAGREGAALAVNGVDNPATAPALNLSTNTVTFSGWIKRDGDQNDWAGLIFNRGGGTAGLNFGTNNELRYHWGGGGNSSYNFNSGLVPPDGVWTFVAMVIEPTRATLYMRPDGGALQSAVNTGTFAVNAMSGDTWIGRDPNSSSRTFTGDLDEIRIYRRSLDLTEITSLAAGGGSASNPSPLVDGAVVLPQGQDLSWKAPPATSSNDVYLGTDYLAVRDATPASPEYLGNTATTSWTPPALTEGLYFWRVDTSDGSTEFPGSIWFFQASSNLVDGLIGWWRFDDGSGPIALDSSSSDADGTLDLPTWTTGVRDGALDFDGDDRVECGTNASLSGTTPFTLAAWVLVPNGSTNNGVIIQQRNGGFNGQYQLRVASDGTVNFYCFGNSATQFDFPSASTVNDGQWHHVAASRDNLGNATIYIDGQPDASVSGTTVRDLNAGIGVGIGCDIRDSNKYFIGSIDDVRIYNRELSGAEVAEVMNRAPYFPVDPIVGGDGAENSPYAGTLSGSADDSDLSETLDYEKLSGPAWLTVATDGTLGGTPAPADVGTNLFQIRVTDSIGATATAQLSITVSDVNDPPAFDSDPILAADATQGVSYGGSIAAEASDPDPGDSLSFEKTSGPAWLSIDLAGNLSGTPGNDDVGTNDFGVRVVDSSGADDTATLRVEVLNVNDPPAFTADPVSGPLATEGVSYTGSIAGSATDIDAGDTLDYSKTSGPAWLDVAPDGSLSGTPGEADVGAQQFGIRVIDGSGAPDDATLEITVQNVNDPPSFTADPIGGADASEDVAYTGTLATAASDPDLGDTLTFTKLGGPAWLTIAPDGGLSGTPTDADLGANSFSVRVSDVAGEQDEATLQIEVLPVNDPPAFNLDPITRGPAQEDVEFSGETLAGTASDPDAGDTLTFAKVSGPTWLTLAPDGSLGGTPPVGAAGTNTFTVRVSDVAGEEDDATLQIEVDEAGLPLPWEESSAGPGLAGGSSHDGGEFTVSGSGRLQGKNDGFHFVSQPVEGDAEIIARIATLDDTGSNARVGVMVRDTLGTNSRHMFLGVDGNGDFRWVRRTSPGGGTSTSGSGAGTPGDTWVRIVRSGDTLRAYKSGDGTSWTMLGSLNAFLPSTCYFGLVVASGSDLELNTSTFTDVSVTP